MEDKNAVFSNMRNQYFASLSGMVQPHFSSCFSRFNYFFFLYFFLAFITFLIFGCMVGWASPALPMLMSEKDPILESGPITTEEASWIGSVFNLGCVLGTLSFGYVVATIGSKQSLYYIALPSLVSSTWIL